MANSEVHTFEDEWYIVRYSGEIPEIAFNSAIHYLTRAQDGPHLTLSEEQNHLLKKAARLLPLFLKTEVDEVKKYHRPSIINCTYSELQQFAEDLQVPLSIELKRLSIFAGTDH